VLIVTGDGVPARRVGARLREGRTTTTNRTFTSSHIPTMRRKVRTRTTIVDLKSPSLLLPHNPARSRQHCVRGRSRFSAAGTFGVPQGRWVLSASQASRMAHSLVGRNTRVCALSNIHGPSGMLILCIIRREPDRDGSSARTAVLSPQSLNRGRVEHGQISQHDERRIWRSA
jgi:hypothetical protein